MEAIAVSNQSDLQNEKASSADLLKSFSDQDSCPWRCTFQENRQYSSQGIYEYALS